LEDKCELGGRNSKGSLGIWKRGPEMNGYGS
jgi:hypothetical protein